MYCDWFTGMSCMTYSRPSFAVAGVATDVARYLLLDPGSDADSFWIASSAHPVKSKSTWTVLVTRLDRPGIHPLPYTYIRFSTNLRPTLLNPDKNELQYTISYCIWSGDEEIYTL